MISAAKQKWFLLRDRASFAPGDPEVIAVIRVPILIGGAKSDEYDVEHAGNAKIDTKNASICIAGTGDGSSDRASWNFVWKGNADASHTFGDLIAGTYLSQGFTGGTRKYMRAIAAEFEDVELLLATDAVDFFDCTDFKIIDEKGFTATIEFQGRDPLNNEELQIAPTGKVRG